jgi:hypothetical protein
MEKIDPAVAVRNALIAGIAEILGDAFVLAVKRPDVLAAAHALVKPTTATVEDPDRRVTKHELGRAIGKSPASIDRFDREPGAPFVYAGDTKRYRIAEYTAWLQSRGKRPTKAPSRREYNDADLHAVAAANGLKWADEGVGK